MAYDGSNRKDIRRAEKAAKLAAANRRATVADIMSRTAGRAWLYEILESCHCFASSFTNSPYATAFREGERNVGLRLLTDVMASCPDEYIIMLREAQERETINADRTDDPREPEPRPGGNLNPVIASDGTVIDYIADEPADAGEYTPQP